MHFDTYCQIAFKVGASTYTLITRGVLNFLAEIPAFSLLGNSISKEQTLSSHWFCFHSQDSGYNNARACFLLHYELAMWRWTSHAASQGFSVLTNKMFLTSWCQGRHSSWSSTLLPYARLFYVAHGNLTNMKLEGSGVSGLCSVLCGLPWFFFSSRRIHELVAPLAWCLSLLPTGSWFL